MNNNEYSYVDYRTFLDPNFKPPELIREIVRSSNSSDDHPIDFSTPLSRILFDIQDVNSNIDSVTTGSAGPLLNHTQSQNNASLSFTDGLHALVEALNHNSQHLENQVGVVYDFAHMHQFIVRRITATQSLVKPLSNFCSLGRQLEINVLAYLPPGYDEPQSYPSLVRCADIIIRSSQIVDRATRGLEAGGLERLRIFNQLRRHVMNPIHDIIMQQSNRIIREFSVPDSETFAQSEANKLRLASAFHSLYFMSYYDFIRRIHLFKPLMLYQAVHAYIRNAVDSCARAFLEFLDDMTLPHNSISRIIKHGQNIMALEHVMSTCWPVSHEVLLGAQTALSYLETFYKYIGTQSLIRLFWQILTEKLRQKVVDIMEQDGMQAEVIPGRTDLIVHAIRDFIDNGSRMPESWVIGSGPQQRDHFLMLPEIADMVTAIVGVLRPR